MSLYDDAVILAKIITDPDTWCEGKFEDYDDQKYHCVHCRGDSVKADYKNPRSIVHDPDCPVLVALDILTKGWE